MNDVDEGTHCVIVPKRVDKSSNKQPGAFQERMFGWGLLEGSAYSNFSVLLKVHVKKYNVLSQLN